MQNFELDNLTHLNISSHNFLQNSDSNKKLTISNEQRSSQYCNQDINQSQIINQKNTITETRKKGIKNIEKQIAKIENAFDINQYSHRIQTFKKGYKNKSQFKQKKQELQQQSDKSEFICKLFKNKNSKVDLVYDKNLNNFLITKQNYNKKEEFERENNVLKFLQNTNITLPLIQTNYDSQKFQQVAGKIDLLQLKKKEKYDDEIIFETFYFILLDKLNKMHELGIAHSDIKPQNIVISYQDEPFFIDFGGSVFLSNENDYQNYLTQYTYAYNLEKYFEFDDQNGQYSPKVFSSKEQIKLCDQVQLSLTFLQLLCKSESQLYDFYSKDYNMLLHSLNYFNDRYPQSMINLRVLTYNISRILNQADPKIKIIYNENYTYFIDERNLQNSLQLSNDIIFKKDKYVVNCINKKNILLIYFLDKQGCDLKIVPFQMQITPQPQNKEYQYISEKYEIYKYHQSLLIEKIDGKYDRLKQNIFNLIKLIKSYNINHFKITLDDFLELFLKNLNKQNLNDTIKIKIKTNFNDRSLKQILEYSNYQFLKYKIQLQKFKIKAQKISFETLYTNVKIINSDVIVKICEKYSCFNYKIIQQKINLIRQNYQIKELILSFQLDFLIFEKELLTFEKEIYNQSKLNDLILNMKKKIKSPIYFLFESFSQEEHLDSFISDILQIKYSGQKIIIKIFDQTFLKIELWTLIKNILIFDKLYYIEIIIVSCLFSEQTYQLLIDIGQFDQVEYKIEEEYIQYYKNKNKILKCEINIQYDQPMNEQRIKINVFNKIVFKQQEKNQYGQDKLQIMSIKCNNDDLIQQQKLQKKQKTYDSQDIEQIQKLFNYDQIKQYKYIEYKDLKIQYEQQIQIQEIRFCNQVIISDNFNDIDLIITNLKNKNNYSQIKIKNHQKKNIFFFEKGPFQILIRMDYIDEAYKMEKFYQLLIAIFEQYNIIFFKKNLDPPFSKTFELSLDIIFQSLYISQQIDIIENWQYNYHESNESEFDHEIIFFVEPQYQKIKQKVIRNTYSIEFNEELLNINQIDKIRDIINNAFKDKLHLLSKYSFIYSIYQRQMQKEFNYQLVLLELGFDNINDSNFKVYFEEIEKLYPHDKIYRFFHQTQITVHTLYNIFEVMQNLKLRNKIQFIFRNISYLEFKQFINDIKKYELINQFIFSLDFCKSQMDFENDFSDVLEIVYQEQHIRDNWYEYKIISQTKQLNSNQQYNKNIFICFQTHIEFWIHKI